MPTLGESDLLVPLHDGMFEAPMWQTFLARLRTTARADFAVLLFNPPDSDEIIELRSDGPSRGDFRRLFAGKYGADPLQSRAMREGRVYTLDELVELGGPKAQGFRDAFLEPQGLTSMRSMRVMEPGGVDAWLSVIGRQPLGAAVGNLFAALLPHMRSALRVFATLEREKARSSMSFGAFQRLNFGWISIDAKCRILDMNPQAARVLQQSGLLRRGPYDRLMLASASIDKDLTSLANRFASDPEARPRAIQLSRDPWMDILVAPLRVEALTSGAQPAAVVYLSGDRRSTADRCEQLADLFHLTPSEARLGWAIAQGHSIAEAATELGLTLETARNYSKRIYAKTGARGQADLVRHILTSVLALA